MGQWGQRTGQWDSGGNGRDNGPILRCRLPKKLSEREHL